MAGGASPQLADSAPLLSRADIRQLERLSLTSLDALSAGLTGQREAGSANAAGIEFAEHRRYVPGDDLRRIDWHAYGRVRELLINAAPAQTRMWLSILLDVSRSMGSESEGAAKLRYGRRLAALLGAVALLRGDAARLHLLSDGEASSGPVLDTAGLLGVLEREATRLPGGRDTQLARSISRADLAAEPAAVTALISDCLVPATELSAALTRLARSAGAPVLLHVLDPAEATAGQLGAAMLRDAETGRILHTVITEQLQHSYAERYAKFRVDTEARCRAAGVHYVPAVTSSDPLELLTELARRGRVIRRGSGG